MFTLTCKYLQLLKSCTNYAYAACRQNTCYVMYTVTPFLSLHHMSLTPQKDQADQNKYRKSNYNNYPLHGERSTTCTVQLNHISFSIWHSLVIQLQCVVKSVEKSGTGVVFIIDIHWHYEYGNKLGKAAGSTCRCNSQRGPKQMRCARPLYCSFIWLQE